MRDRPNGTVHRRCAEHGRWRGPHPGADQGRLGEAHPWSQGL